MASEVVMIWDKLKSFFGKAFKNAPSDLVVAQAALNTAAPLFEAVATAVDPELAVVAGPIISEIQTDLGTVSGMLQTGSITSVGTFLVAIKENFSTLLTEAKITDPASVAKASTFLSVIQSIASAVAAVKV